MPTYRDKKYVRDLLRKRSKGKCEYCKVKMTKTYTKQKYCRPWTATIDHVKPKSQGGTYHLENLKLVCYQCNQDKASKSLKDFLKEKEKENESTTN